MKGERWKRQAKGGNMKDEDKSELRGEGKGARGQEGKGCFRRNGAAKEPEGRFERKERRSL